MNGILIILFWLPAVGAMAQRKSAPTKMLPPVAASIQKGKGVYTQFCLACHQADGLGVPNLNPPLSGTPNVLGNKAYLVEVLLKGSKGKVEIDGELYNNAMPPQAHLTDAQIADVLNYIRNNFGNKAAVVTPADVKAVRSKSK